MLELNEELENMTNEELAVFLEENENSEHYNIIEALVSIYMEEETETVEETEVDETEEEVMVQWTNSQIVPMSDIVHGVFEGEEVISIYGLDAESVQAVVEDFEYEIRRQREDEENNYGLLFYRCGYSGPEQQATQQYYWEEYGVCVS